MRRDVTFALVGLTASLPGLAMWQFGTTGPAAVGTTVQVSGILATVLLVVALLSGVAVPRQLARALLRERARLSAMALAVTLFHLALAVSLPASAAVAEAGGAPVGALLVGLASLPLAPVMAASRRWLRAALGAAWHALPLAAVAGAVLLAGHGAVTLDGEGAAWAWLHMLPLLLAPAVPLLRRRAGKVDAWG